MKKVKLILDTDIGDDIDDAYALALSYFHPNIDLIGVTTVYRNTIARAKQVKEFFKVVDEKNIEVYPGIENPIKKPITLFKKDQPIDGIYYPCQYSFEYEKNKIGKINAVDYLYQEINKYPNELTIAAIGPLTNIANLILKYPDVKDKLKQITIMGGWFSENIPEWNILCDPEAADLVFKSGIPIFAIGLDVTLQCHVEPNLLKQLEYSEKPINKLLFTWFKRWKKHFNFDKSVMHDPLAITTLIADVCQFEKQNISVDLINNKGAIMVSNNKKGSDVYVATSVNKDLFFNIFKSIIL